MRAERPTIIDFLTMTETECLAYFAKAYGIQEQGEDFLLLQGGELPLMLLAHVDTVDTLPPTRGRIIEERGVLRTDGTCVLGADDRAGLWAISEILTRCEAEGLPKPHVLLTDKEECGGIGAREAAEHPAVLDLAGEINLMVELDRYGANDAAYYSYSLPPEVEEYAQSFGWETTPGSYTDIATITEHTGLPGVNLSVGYYDQHTSEETLVLATLQATVERVTDMIRDPLMVKTTEKGDWGMLDIEDDCEDCGHRWYACDCGAVAKKLIEEKSTGEIAQLLEEADEGTGVMIVGDPVYNQLCKKFTQEIDL